jgi:hypothetical protein
MTEQHDPRRIAFRYKGEIVGVADHFAPDAELPRGWVWEEDYRKRPDDFPALRDVLNAAGRPGKPDEGRKPGTSPLRRVAPHTFRPEKAHPESRLPAPQAAPTEPGPCCGALPAKSPPAGSGELPAAKPVPPVRDWMVGTGQPDERAGFLTEYPAEWIPGVRDEPAKVDPLEVARSMIEGGSRQPDPEVDEVRARLEAAAKRDVDRRQRTEPGDAAQLAGEAGPDVLAKSMAEARADDDGMAVLREKERREAIRIAQEHQEAKAAAARRENAPQLAGACWFIEKGEGSARIVWKGRSVDVPVATLEEVKRLNNGCLTTFGRYFREAFQGIGWMPGTEYVLGEGYDVPRRSAPLNVEHDGPVKEEQREREEKARSIRAAARDHDRLAKWIMRYIPDEIGAGNPEGESAAEVAIRIISGQKMRHSEEAAVKIRGAVARAWCHPKNERKEMDPDLALAAADEVLALVGWRFDRMRQPGPRYWWDHEREEWVRAAYNMEAQEALHELVGDTIGDIWPAQWQRKPVVDVAREILQAGYAALGSPKGTEDELSKLFAQEVAQDGPVCDSCAQPVNALKPMDRPLVNGWCKQCRYEFAHGMRAHPKSKAVLLALPFEDCRCDSCLSAAQARELLWWPNASVWVDKAQCGESHRGNYLAPEEVRQVRDTGLRAVSAGQQVAARPEASAVVIYARVECGKCGTTYAGIPASGRCDCGAEKWRDPNRDR